MKLEKLVKKQSFSALKKILDKLFSEYIRRRGKGKCFICKCVKHWKQQQAGHYIPRRHMQFRYDEKNVNCNCVRCNVMLHGNMIAYREEMVKTYGKEWVEVMEAERHKPFKLYTSDLITQISYYKQEIEKLNKGDVGQGPMEVKI